MWRILDVREKMNLPFTYPLEPFFSIIADAAQSGEIKVFKDETFKEMMTPEEVAGTIAHQDTSLIFNPDTYEDEVVIVNNPVNPEDIKLSLIHISEPTRLLSISYAVFCL